MPALSPHFAPATPTLAIFPTYSRSTLPPPSPRPLSPAQSPFYAPSVALVPQSSQLVNNWLWLRFSTGPQTSSWNGWVQKTLIERRGWTSTAQSANALLISEPTTSAGLGFPTSRQTTAGKEGGEGRGGGGSRGRHYVIGSNGSCEYNVQSVWSASKFRT